MMSQMDHAYDSFTFLMVRTNLSGRYTYANRKFIEEYGWLYPDGNFIGKESLSSIFEYDHVKVRDAVAKCVAEPGQIIKVEIDKPSKDGSVRTTIWDFVCVTDAVGTPLEIQCTGIDITDRIQAERTLKESVEQLDSLSFITSEFLRQENWEEILNDVFELVGRTLKVDRVYYFENHFDSNANAKSSIIRVEWVNEGISSEIDNPLLQDISHELFSKQIGLLSRNLPFQSIVSQIEEDDLRLAFAAQQISSLLAVPVMVDDTFFGFIGVDDCHHERVWKDGEITYLRNIASSLSLAIIRQNNTRQLRQWNERFEIITNATNDAIWDYEFTKGRLFRGHGFKTLFGYETGHIEPGHMELLELVHPDDRGWLTERYAAMFRPDCTDTNWEVEYRLRRSDGTYAYVIERAVYIRNEAGEAVRAVGATTDITHRHEYEESLKKLNLELEKNIRELALSNQDLEQFAYVTSHDLQEPLRMVSSFMTLLEKKYGEQLDEKALQYIHFATDGAKRMRQIILDLLEFSKVGKYEEQPTLVPLNDVVSETLALYRRLISESKAVVKVGKLPTVTYYRTPLAQIFQNLLANALRYSKVGVSPHIEISTVEHNHEHEIMVSDNGIGISPEFYGKIFVMFHRLNPDFEDTGTGIGLSVVKKILDRMGGRIWVDSEEGVGSTFHFTIPKMPHRE